MRMDKAVRMSSLEDTGTVNSVREFLGSKFKYDTSVIIQSEFYRILKPSV